MPPLGEARVCVTLGITGILSDCSRFQSFEFLSSSLGTMSNEAT